MSNLLSPANRRRQVVKFIYCVTKVGLNAKEAAALIGISEKLAGKWVREHRLKPRMKQLQKELHANPLKFDESLSAFKAYIRIKNPQLHESLEPVYNQFLNTL